ncbi:MAG: DNA polymerase IV [Hyphomicrobiales bacterium]
MEDPPRKIIHIDMDAFFASVEQRDDPALRGRPVAVGGAGERGVVAAASYEARRFSVRSAMASSTARRKCPDLVFVKPRFEVYREVSLQIREILADYASLIEPLSLDEAYLDVTDSLQELPTATAVAERIRARILERTQLTASAGVSYCKFLAKLASDYRKPDGLFVITPRMGPAFVEVLPVGKIHGIGPATERKMNDMGIFTGGDLRAQPLERLTARFGKAGAHYYSISRGIDLRPVRPDRERKSVGAEETFASDLHDFEELAAELDRILERLWERCVRARVRGGRTVTLKVKFANFNQVTRSRTSPGLTGRDGIRHAGLALLQGLCPVAMGVRLLGLTLSGLDDAEQPGDPQLSFELAL